MSRIKCGIGVKKLKPAVKAGFRNLVFFNGAQVLLFSRSTNGTDISTVAA